jgi:uncharacterized protein Yka (UPF0111/DUF47 family)
VRRTFITPFDRNDIQDLISSLDDSIDQMNKTAKTITLFGVKSFEPCSPSALIGQNQRVEERRISGSS